jgi:hypothetical protein
MQDDPEIKLAMVKLAADYDRLAAGGERKKKRRRRSSQSSEGG